MTDYEWGAHKPEEVARQGRAAVTSSSSKFSNPLSEVIRMGNYQPGDGPYWIEPCERKACPTQGWHAHAEDVDGIQIPDEVVEEIARESAEILARDTSVPCAACANPINWAAYDPKRAEASA